MKQYLCFLTMVLLSTRASTARAILIDYKSIAITLGEDLGITDNLAPLDAMTINISVESGYFFYGNFESMVSEIVRIILEYPQFPPQTFNSLNGAMINLIPDPPAIILIGFGLISLAIVGRKQFKK